MSDAAAVLIARLHRMVRAGYRPWLGYDVASGLDQDIHLRRRGSKAQLRADGSVAFDAPLALPDGRRAGAIAGDDHATFDALFPPNRPNTRNLTRRLYEIGV